MHRRSWVQHRSQGFNPLGRRPQRRPPENAGGRGSQYNPSGPRPGGGPGTYDKMTVKLLNLYLENKWNEQARMLDLDSLVNSEALAELSPNLNNFSFCHKLAQCIADGKKWSQSLDSINFSHNGIRSIRHLTTALLDRDVKLLNISFSSNQITDLSEVDNLVDMNLREVIFVNNPIAKQGGYHEYVVKKIRSLELLDEISVKDWKKQLLPKLPEPQDSQFSTETNAILVTQLSAIYFKCVDAHNFDDLVDAYDNDAVFSYTVERSHKIYPHPNAKEFQHGLTVRGHNLLDPGVLKNPIRNIHKGRAVSIEALRRLYGKITTTHDVSRFKCDAIMLGETVIATIHGIMKYQADGDKSSYAKCFDRTFILRPNKAGTAWPARIANDTIIFRAEEPNPMLLPEMDLKSKLMAATGLNEAFASLLMKEASHNYDQAMLMFTQSRASIPPQAFASPPPA